MGYTSDTVLILTQTCVERLNRDKARFPHSSSAAYMLEHADRHMRDDVLGAELWFWKHIKWYQDEPEDFPEIDFMDRFMESLDDADYYFIRIGEDYDDVEIRGSWWGNPFGAALRREIALDCASQKCG